MTLDWVPPLDINFYAAVVCVAPGTEAPPLVGCTEGYRGGESNVLISGLEPGQPYTFAVYSVDSEGTEGGVETISVGATRLSLKANKSRITYGDEVTFSGRVTDAQTGEGVGQAQVILAAVDAAEEVIVVDSLSADAAGNFSYTTTPPANFQFFVVNGGDRQLLGGNSGLTRVTVSSLLVLDPVRKKVKLGKPVQLFVGAAPVDRKKPIVVEQLIKGNWKKVAKVKPDREGIGVAKLKVTKKGTYSYRAYRPAAGGASSGTSKKVKVKVI